MGYLEKLVDLIGVLRSENGCPWDREQTHATLRPNMVEEAYEAIDAINDNDMKHLQEELGDVLLQVILHSQIAKEEGAFDIEDVAKGLHDKIIHRHPHVFGDVKVNSPEEALLSWDKIKKEEKSHRKSAMDGVSKAQSALMSAQKISKKAVKCGFEWPNEDSLYDCIKSEFKEFEDAVKSNDKENMEEEMGDILFAVVNLARWNQIDAEQALIKANQKFMTRFRKMEELAQKPLEEYSLEEYDTLWKSAVIQWSRYGSHLRRLFIYPLIDLFRRDTRFDALSNIIKNSNINLTAFPNSFNLFRRLNNIVRWNNMSLSRKLNNLFIKCLMAFLIFFSASTPAEVITS